LLFVEFSHGAFCFLCFFHVFSTFFGLGVACGFSELLTLIFVCKELCIKKSNLL